MPGGVARRSARGANAHRVVIAWPNGRDERGARRRWWAMPGLWTAPRVRSRRRATSTTVDRAFSPAISRCFSGAPRGWATDTRFGSALPKPMPRQPDQRRGFRCHPLPCPDPAHPADGGNARSAPTNGAPTGSAKAGSSARSPCAGGTGASSSRALCEAAHTEPGRRRGICNLTCTARPFARQGCLKRRRRAQCR